MLTPFPGDQPKCIGWGAGGEGWWGLADSHLGVPLSGFLYRPQNLPAVEHSRKQTSPRVQGAALLLRRAWERLAGEGACVGF